MKMNNISNASEITLLTRKNAFIWLCSEEFVILTKAASVLFKLTHSVGLIFQSKLHN